MQIISRDKEIERERERESVMGFDNKKIKMREEKGE